MKYLYGLVSLWDMLQIYAHEYIELGRTMENVSGLLYLVSPDLENDLPDSRLLTDAEKRNLKNDLERLEKHCRNLGLATSIDLLEKALKNLPTSHRELEVYLEAVQSELKGRLFFYVPFERARYFKVDTKSHEGKPSAEMEAAFPMACNEMHHAHNCYVFGEYTAAVFHAMRATEIALKAVAHFLGKPPPTGTIESAEWAALIRLIDDHVVALQKQQRSTQRDADLQFYSDANSQFINFKDAFRKYVAHARESYGEALSISILHRTREFLETLSSRMKEPI